MNQHEDARGIHDGVPHTRVLACDVDGTLLDENERFMPFAKEVLQQVSSKWLVILCSARPVQAMEWIPAQVPFPCGGFVAFNGAIMKRLRPAFGEAIQVLHHLPTDVVHRVYSLTRTTPEISVRLHSCDLGIIACDGSTWPNDHIRYFRPQQQLTSISEVAKLGPVVKVACFSSASFCETLISPQLDHRVCIFRSKKWLVEIVPQCARKGSALLQLIGEPTTCEERTVVAVGDGENDREMFSLAQASITFEGSSENIREAATHVVRPVDTCGWLDITKILGAQE